MSLDRRLLPTEDRAVDHRNSRFLRQAGKAFQYRIKFQFLSALPNLARSNSPILAHSPFSKIEVRTRSPKILMKRSLGIGCTVWYGLAPGVPLHAPSDTNLFSPFDSYDPFFNMEYHPANFRRVCFVESQDVSASVTAAFVNEHPFAEITIPASGPVLKAVGLGVMIAFFMAVGIVPGAINEQL